MLVNLDITKDDISDILEASRFKGYRFDGALKWILKTIQIIRELEKDHSLKHPIGITSTPSSLVYAYSVADMIAKKDGLAITV